VKHLFPQRMNKPYRIFLVLFIVFSACISNPIKLTRITGSQHHIDGTLAEDTVVTNFIAPYQKHLNEEMDSVLAYCPVTLSKKDGALNTAIGNMMADAVYQQVQPVFKKRTGKDIDFVLLNYGGIRSIIPKGNITMRTAYEVMPFENYVVVVELSAEKIEEMLHYLMKGQIAHPLSAQIQITLTPNGSLHELRIHGKPLVANQSYYVATSNYMANGGDFANFFLNPLSTTETDYLLRNALIDYFKKIDTLAPVADKRFIKLP
jgi:2',3'-cyclic-nucleotide 2'-phosphodiesterase (5'-nucleotidase family)